METDFNIFELHAIAWGRVQGVGFRVAVRHYAVELGLRGYVRNLADGNVEIVAQGSRKKLELLIEKVKEHFSNGYIARFDLKYSKPIEHFELFKIIQ